MVTGKAVDAPAGSPPQRTGRSALRGRPLSWTGVTLALLALALWLRDPVFLTLVIAAVGVGLSLVIPRTRSGLVGPLILALAVGAAVATQHRLHLVETDWPRILRTAEESAAAALRNDLDVLLDRGEIAIDGAISATLEQRPGRIDLESVRSAAGVSAVAVYDAGRRLRAWGGEHHGEIPPAVAAANRPYMYRDGPLFGYLYTARSLPEGWTVVAATLLHAEMEIGGERTFVESFERAHDVRPEFARPDRARGPAVWDWGGEEPILSVSFATLTQSEWRDRAQRDGRRLVGAIWLLAFGWLVSVWYRRRGPPALPVVIGVAGALLLPLGELTGAEALFSPTRFVLPGPLPLTLGHLLVLLVGAVLGVLVWRGRSGSGRTMLPLRVLGAAIALPLVLAGIVAAASLPLLAAEEGGGWPLLITAALAGALLLRVLMPSGSGTPDRRGTALLLGAATLAVLLALGAFLLWAPDRPTPVWAAGLWALPFALVCYGRNRVARFARWLALGWIATTAVLPVAWSGHLEARLADAEAELGRLGTTPDPFLDFLLRQFAEETRILADEGERGVNLLYRGWIGSGLAGEGYEARLTLWEEGEVAAELRLGDLPLPLDRLTPILERLDPAEERLVVERHDDRPYVHYLLASAIGEEQTVSVAVPPQRTLRGAVGHAMLAGPGDRLRPLPPDASLTLVPDPAPPPELLRETAEGRRPVLWERVPGGWQSETIVDYPEGPAHAHLLLRTGPPTLVAARAGMRAAVVLGILAFLWGIALVIRGEAAGLSRLPRIWLGSFRGRLTLALLLFFLIPTAAFGAVAFEALSREVLRGTTERVTWSLEQAARAAGAERLSELSARLRSELLLYRNAVLVDAGSPEVLDLGLYPVWVSPPIWGDFERGERLEVVERRQLGGQEYLVAYRRVGPGEILAAPAPLAAGEIARRRREFADVVLFAVLLGGLLSVVLSLAVGRALSRPIEEVSRAAALVGRGNLKVQLGGPRPDEFAVLVESFNAMVARLRRARGALLREKRRTDAIVQSTATGVVALDEEGVVTLSNPGAAEILGVRLERNRPLPAGAPLLGIVAEAVEDFRRQDVREVRREVEVEERTLRLQMRKLRGRGGSGLVLTLEDITAEVRTARILAWGEMARQVAHEIKNPLTPIKLAVQHLRRAHADRRPDFPEILDRNVSAILREIDRLSAIARSFARFGAPEERAGPLELASPATLVSDVLSLYHGGADGIRYDLEADPGVPLVHVRPDEFREVLVNLLENAREAMRGAGRIEVRVSPDSDGEHVEVTVSDSGEGIDPELLPRIFDPHFSTRTSGTGLGLAIVRRLVESWGGQVEAESVPHRGTTIRLLLRTAESVGSGSVRG